MHRLDDDELNGGERRFWYGPEWRKPGDDQQHAVVVTYRLACSCLYQPHGCGPSGEVVLPGAVRDCVRNGHGDQVVVAVRSQLYEDQTPPLKLASPARQTAQT